MDTLSAAPPIPSETLKHCLCQSTIHLFSWENEELN